MKSTCCSLGHVLAFLPSLSFLVQLLFVTGLWSGGTIVEILCAWLVVVEVYFFERLFGVVYEKEMGKEKSRL